jgi:hypothetical protein
MRMVSVTSLWLPVLLSAVIVFVASSIMHMVLPYHHSDYKQLPDEDKVVSALRAAGVKRGLYMFPFCTHKNMNSPEMVEKLTHGPVGSITVFPSGRPVIAKFMIMWFVYCLIVGAVVACLASRTIMPGASYPSVFHVVAMSAFLAYGIGILSNGIWKSQPWGMVTKEVIDGLIYALLTAGTFGWLWPR